MRSESSARHAPLVGRQGHPKNPYAPMRAFRLEVLLAATGEQVPEAQSTVLFRPNISTGRENQV